MLWHRAKKYSWLPQWETGKFSLIGPWDLNFVFEPSRGMPFQRHSDPTIPDADLALDAVIFDTVLWVGQVSLQPSEWETPKAQFEDIVRLFHLGAFGELTVEKLAFIGRTIRARRDAYGGITPSPTSSDEDLFTAHFANLLSTLNVPLPPAVRSLAAAGNKDIFLEAAQNVCSPCRSIFFTMAGHFGLGPYSTAVGDLVAVLGGAHMPVVLGRATREPLAPEPAFDGYELIGECFVDDILHGEIIDATIGGKTHRGPFEPRLLFERLFNFCALAESSRSEYEGLRKVVWRKCEGELEQRRLEVEVIKLIDTMAN
ncbi:hypothetical protein BDV96DRAFT_574892 [Lophiotrema nucula]|uniref:Uncharacterized protein n=1 Tax=Lophiotrema nucula TaxID=690887 RepID=A0A6A5ZA69_9PLEO|nr:hypothetical protein BDV96DRAFT_574892 [Lophiotrema nucula]